MIKDLTKFLGCLGLIFLFRICIAVDVSLTSTGPVMFDTPIRFIAKIEGYESGNYAYKWKDDTHYSFEDFKEGPFSNWSIIYKSDGDRHHMGKRTVTVSVYYDTVLYIPIPIATKKISFELTEFLNGNMTVKQQHVQTTDPHFVSTLNATNITTILYDPDNWILSHTKKVTFYFQIINRETREDNMLGPCLTPSVIYNISKPADYIIQGNVVLLLSDTPITTTTSTTTTTTTTPATTTTTTTNNSTTSSTTPKTSPTHSQENSRKLNPSSTSNETSSNSALRVQVADTFVGSSFYVNDEGNILPARSVHNYECDGWWSQMSSSPLTPEVLETVMSKYGIFTYYIAARVPLEKFNITGNKFLKHGEMLELNITCNGSGPFNYCFNITFGAFNNTDKMFCNEHNSISNECSFMIHRYLRQIGTYSVVISVYNEVSHVMERTGINVYVVDRKPQLSYIIIPISCSLVVIIIIVFGIAHFYQSTKRYSIEVADFDFCASEETEYKSFYQQLKEAIYTTCSSEIDNSDSGWRPPRSHVERPRVRTYFMPSHYGTLMR